MKIYKIDQGIGFGKWDDSVSRMMYYQSTEEILTILNELDSSHEVIADYGGANGILKQFIPDIITIDIDDSKNPDIVDDILMHKGKYDLIIIRFVLHYLNDYEVLQLFNHLNNFHKGRILIIQFTNNDLKRKYQNSKNELKYFRTDSQLKALLPPGDEIYSLEYEVNPEFYKNRLNIDNAHAHQETIKAYYI